VKIGVPKEIVEGEYRVAATPQSVKRLRKLGFEVQVECCAGEASDAPDALYLEAGATIEEDAAKLWETSDIIIKVRAPAMHPKLGVHEADLIEPGGVLISFIWPAQNEELVEKLAARKATVLAMDCIPRITRAQRMDALSAMANIAGYRAIIEAANCYPRFFAGQITAAGKMPPAEVLVVGAGVAGLAAIGTARGLGAQVRAFDSRKEVRDQIQSMGAEFVELDFDESGEGEGGYAKAMSDAFLQAEIALLAQHALEVDIIITTALIPGRRAPVLITQGMVESMREGSVIVDLAAQQRGNCALTEPDEVVVHKGVSIIGYTNLPARMASQSSQLYGINVAHFLDELGGDENFQIDYDNEITRGALILDKGEKRWPPPKHKSAVVPDTTPTKRADTAAPIPQEKPKPKGDITRWVTLIIIGLAMAGIGWKAPESFLTHFTVFVLACFIGWQVIWNVTPALHTPLMSVTNAISGIIIIGGMLQLTGGELNAPMILGTIAVFVATINIAGGFLVTRRMLAMFQR
jgi:proton-translocating NAD(P)+ transhydrogenase subunit alpha